MLTDVRRASTFAVAALCLIGSGCATAKPVPQPSPSPRPAIRDATPEERAIIGRLIVPLLITSGMWKGAADGCAAVLGILPSPAINLSVGPSPQCKFSLVITETALNALSHDELRAAMAHEIGHVQLGHFSARKVRREAEKKEREAINDKTNTAAAVTAIPIIGPILAIGVAGTQMVTEQSVGSEYRAYDREEELQADRFGIDLLQLVIGRARACAAEVALLERLVEARTARPWAAWINTHPQPAERLKIAQAACPA